FVLLQELYDGDWSRVYKMAERTTGRLVAVKVIKPQTNIKLVNNIVEEVKFLGSLKHPRILEVEAIDETDEGFKVRMEYLPLGDLRAYVDLHGTLKDSPAARFTDQILDALAFLHGQKLVHRDIKPGNIMISALVPFEVKLTDLGLIKVIEAGKNVHLTQCGSPAYMAPEIWDGHPSKGKAAVGARQDQKIDIWALGVTLWFTLCKEHPF
ncbi:kinase-like protein, partial [Myriangium duriaei CBS 260.36]